MAAHPETSVWAACFDFRHRAYADAPTWWVSPRGFARLSFSTAHRRILTAAA